jgi:class 3 adenylate cyclase
MLDDDVRPIAVLFADLVAYLPRTFHLSPKEALAVLNPALAAMIAAVDENGGRVLRCFGDSIVAICDSGSARDDSLNAVRAALKIQARLSALDFQARCGIAWGHAYVGEIGSTVYREFSVVGSCIDLAARLQKLAAPGGTICNEAVHGHTADVFHWRPDSYVIKGIPIAVCGYALESEYAEYAWSSPVD